MITTSHILARMSQRGIPKKLLELVYEYGKEKDNKLILNRKTTQMLIEEIDSMRKELLRIIDKGGVTLVVDNDTLITTYNTKSTKRH